MKSLHGKLTYANVVATLALFLVLAGGTAFAASQFGKESIGTRALKKEAVTPAKLSQKSKAALTGAAGPAGRAGPAGPAGPKGAPGDPGAPGSALAYARIEFDGTLDAAASKNIASVFHSSTTGVYCITPAVPVSSAIVSTPHAVSDTGTLAQVNVVEAGDIQNGTCGTPVWVGIRNAAGANENHTFYVVFN